MTTTIDLREIARAFVPRVDARPELQEAAMATWHARMINEYASSRVFIALARQMRARDFDEEDCDEVEQFAEEERKHGVLCGAVVESLGGRATGSLFESPKFPEHRDAAPRAAVMRNVISICCMSETAAVALIGAERLAMPDSELRALLTKIWADEIGHARFGWRLLERVAPSFTESERAAIRAYVPIALAHLIAHEHAHLPPRRAPLHGETLGLCSGIDGRALLRETIDEVIVPRIQLLLA